MNWKPNVILITIDALRSDRLSCMGYKKGTSPNVDEFADDGILFTQAVSNGPQTRDSFPSIMTSTYSFMNPGERCIPSSEKDTLAEVLKKEGYTTAGFHSIPSLSRLYSNYDRGFGTFKDFMGGSEKSKIFQKMKEKTISGLKKVGLLNFAKKSRNLLMDVPYERAVKMNEEVLSWLRNNPEEPFFLWIHYMDPHEPYMPPGKYLRQLGSEPMSTIRMSKLLTKSREGNISNKEINELINLYDAEIRYADEFVGNLLEELKEMSLYEENVIALTADHGEAFGEHEKFGHGADLYEELIRVPLILKSPNLERGRKFEEQTELLDLAPTILDLAGLPKSKKFLGKSILSLLDIGGSNSNSVISEAKKWGRVSCRTSKWKLIRKDKDKRELYNLEDDPEERNNLHDSEKEVRRRLEKRIKKHLDLEEKIRIRKKINNL